MSNLPELLAQNPVFAHFGSEQRAAIAASGLARSYGKSELIVLGGDVWPYLILVSQGVMDAVKESSEGRRLIVTTLTPGDLFWGLAFFNEGASMPVHLEAREPCQIHLWRQEALLPLLVENGWALWAMCQLMINRMQRASEIVEGLAFQPVAARLARLLVDRFGESAGAPVARDLTLDDMAALVGTTREMVCRILYHFSDKKLIQITRTEFMLTDTAGLLGLADQ